MRRIPTSLFRYARRGIPSPSPRSFVTSAQRLQANHSDAPEILVTTSKFTQADRTENVPSLEIPIAQSTEELQSYLEPSAAETREEQRAYFPHRKTMRKSPAPILKTIGEADMTVSKIHRKLTIEGPDTDPISFSYLYLRDLCKCPRCVDPHSKQRSFRTSDINKLIEPSHIRWDGEYLEITWDDSIPDHVSRWHYSYLQNHPINTHDAYTRGNEPMTWTAKRMQEVQHWISYEDYINNNEQFTIAMRNLQRTGLIFVKDIPDSREMVEKIANRLGPLRNTFYGMTWDVRTVPQAKNVAYTNQFLGFHMDLMYMNEPPGYQLLHCIENSCDGGESLFADAFWAAGQMRDHFPKQFHLLTKLQLAYEYVHEDQIYYNRRPVFELDPRTHQLNYVNYSPPFQSSLTSQSKTLVHQDDPDAMRALLNPRIIGPKTFSSIKTALTHFTRFLERPSNHFQLKLNPGECAIFNNRRIVHARRQFDTTSGSRWLAGAYVDTDAVNSRFHVCNKNLPEVWNKTNPYKRVNPFAGGIGGENSVTEAIQGAYAMQDDMAREERRFRHVKREISAEEEQME
ncbi:hypothetical protein N7456_013390 [Penicillium angulare]|uniref:TauD/TfdA-like domain-containing protein n=1 Tax=Penicillium angulare TaxID=116970 RepID=A0A9W9JTY1_9EURO|nr:hypothetical protein N7456_013390 [Penicillium angulare]